MNVWEQMIAKNSYRNQRRFWYIDGNRFFHRKGGHKLLERQIIEYEKKSIGLKKIY